MFIEHHNSTSPKVKRLFFCSLNDGKKERNQTTKNIGPLPLEMIKLVKLIINHTTPRCTTRKIIIYIPRISETFFFCRLNNAKECLYVFAIARQPWINRKNSINRETKTT